jgi:hypothetical protein
LLAFLKDPALSANVDWDGLAADLSTEHATCTVGALKKRISRIKTAVKEDNEYALCFKIPSNYTNLRARQ